MDEKEKKKAPYIKPTVTQIKKPYLKPTVTKLTPEQAKLKLLGIISQDWEGAEEAKELLKLLFPDLPTEAPDKKKSA